MKKLLLITISLMIGLFALAQIKTTPPVCEKHSVDSKGTWAMASDFTATDIDGTSHTLFDYLAAGKTVIIDFSCCWCSPCWSLHQSGVLDGLHDAYGPDGTDELVVLWVEVQSTNTIDQIYGTTGTTGDSYADVTQGDWTEGGTWPVPIIDNASLLSGFSELYEGYVPTVFMVCPSGYYKDITDQCWDGVATVYAELGSCPASGQAPVAEIEGPSSGYVGNTLDFTAGGISVDPITDYAWTFESGTPATSDVESPSVSWDTPGDYQVTLITTNANGTSDPVSITVSIVDPGAVDDKNVTFEEIIVNTEFPSSLAPYNWTTADEDGGTVWENYSDWGLIGADNSFVVYSHSLAASDYAPYAGDKCALAMTNNPGSGNGSYNDDWMISPQFTLGTGSSFSLYVTSTNTTWGNELYKLGVSTTTNDPASFTIIGGTRTAGASWEQITLDLSAYDGQDIYIAVVYVGEDTFAFMTDNMVLTTMVGVEDNITQDIHVYPNPASDIITVKNAENSDITVLNMIGEIVMTVENANATENIEVSKLPVGNYIVKVNQEIFKINISR